MDYTEDPGHYWSPGCCSQDRPAHQWSPREAREVEEWLATEPGMEQRLHNRYAQLQRFLRLGAPEIVLREQLRLVLEAEDQLWGPQSSS